MNSKAIAAGGLVWYVATCAALLTAFMFGWVRSASSGPGWSAGSIVCFLLAGAARGWIADKVAPMRRQS